MEKLYLEIKYGKDNAAQGYILDLSRGGMALACSRIINNNVIVEIIIKKHNFAPLRGKIVSVAGRRSKTYGYRLGIKFISVIKKKEKLAEFISGAENRKKARLNLL